MADKKQRKRRGFSPIFKMKRALNDVLNLMEEAGYTEMPEYKLALEAFEEAGLVRTPSSSARIAEIEKQMHLVDLSDPEAESRLKDLSEQLGKIRRGVE